MDISYHSAAVGSDQFFQRSQMGCRSIAPAGYPPRRMISGFIVWRSFKVLSRRLVSRFPKIINCQVGIICLGPAPDEGRTEFQGFISGWRFTADIIWDEFYGQHELFSRDD